MQAWQPHLAPRLDRPRQQRRAGQQQRAARAAHERADRPRALRLSVLERVALISNDDAVAACGSGSGGGVRGGCTHARTSVCVQAACTCACCGRPLRTGSRVKPAGRQLGNSKRTATASPAAAAACAGRRLRRSYEATSTCRAGRAPPAWVASGACERVTASERARDCERLCECACVGGACAHLPPAAPAAAARRAPAARRRAAGRSTPAAPPAKWSADCSAPPPAAANRLGSSRRQ